MFNCMQAAVLMFIWDIDRAHKIIFDMIVTSGFIASGSRALVGMKVLVGQRSLGVRSSCAFAAFAWEDSHWDNRASREERRQNYSDRQDRGDHADVEAFIERNRLCGKSAAYLREQPRDIIDTIVAGQQKYTREDGLGGDGNLFLDQFNLFLNGWKYKASQLKFYTLTEPHIIRFFGENPAVRGL